MKKWQQWLAGAAVLTVLVSVSGTASAAPAGSATPSEPNSGPSEPAHHHPHDGEHHKHELTQAQKDTLKQAGVDFKELRSTGEQIHDALKNIREQRDLLKETVKDSKDTGLHEQLRSDLQSFRENMKAARDLHIANRGLIDDMRQAADAKQVAKVKEIYGKMVANQKQELKLVQAAQTTLQNEVKKIQKQVKK